MWWWTWQRGAVNEQLINRSCFKVNVDRCAAERNSSGGARPEFHRLFWLWLPSATETTPNSRTDLVSVKLNLPVTSERLCPVLLFFKSSLQFTPFFSNVAFPRDFYLKTPNQSLVFNPLTAKVANLRQATLLNKTGCIYKCGAESCYHFSPGEAGHVWL